MELAQEGVNGLGVIPAELVRRKDVDTHGGNLAAGARVRG